MSKRDDDSKNHNNNKANRDSGYLYEPAALSADDPSVCCGLIVCGALCLGAPVVLFFAVQPLYEIYQAKSWKNKLIYGTWAALSYATAYYAGKTTYNAMSSDSGIIYKQHLKDGVNLPPDSTVDAYCDYKPSDCYTSGPYFQYRYLVAPLAAGGAEGAIYNLGSKLTDYCCKLFSRKSPILLIYKRWLLQIIPLLQTTLPHPTNL